MEELKGVQMDTPLSQGFFSKININSLQTTIRYQVWLNTNKQHVIGYQNENELKVIMRSIFLQNSLNQPTNLVQQISDLNKLVIDFSVNAIITQIQQYISYNEHISKERQVIDHSVNTSVRGSKQLEMKPWF